MLQNIATKKGCFLQKSRNFQSFNAFRNANIYSTPKKFSSTGLKKQHFQTSYIHSKPSNNNNLILLGLGIGFVYSQLMTNSCEETEDTVVIDENINIPIESQEINEKTAQFQEQNNSDAQELKQDNEFSNELESKPENEVQESKEEQNQPQEQNNSEVQEVKQDNEFSEEEFESKYRDFLEKKMKEEIEKRKITNSNRYNEEREKLNKELKEALDAIKERSNNHIKNTKESLRNDVVNYAFLSQLNFIIETGSSLGNIIIKRETLQATVQHIFKKYEYSLQKREEEVITPLQAALDQKIEELEELEDFFTGREKHFREHLKLQNSIYRVFKILEDNDTSKFNEIEPLSQHINDNWVTRFSSFKNEILSQISTLTSELSSAPICPKTQLYSDFQDLKKELSSELNIPEQKVSIYRDENVRNFVDPNEEKLLYKALSYLPNQLVTYFYPALTQHVNILIQAENELLQENISAAITQLQQLDGISERKMAEWIEKARRYQIANDLVRDLRANLIKLSKPFSVAACSDPLKV